MLPLPIIKNPQPFKLLSSRSAGVSGEHLPSLHRGRGSDSLPRTAGSPLPPPCVEFQRESLEHVIELNSNWSHPNRPFTVAFSMHRANPERRQEGPGRAGLLSPISTQKPWGSAVSTLPTQLGLGLPLKKAPHCTRQQGHVLSLSLVPQGRVVGPCPDCQAQHSPTGCPRPLAGPAREPRPILWPKVSEDLSLQSP